MLRITEKSSTTDKTIVALISYVFFGLTFILISFILSKYIGNFWAFILILSYSYALIFATRVLRNFTKQTEQERGNQDD